MSSLIKHPKDFYAGLMYASIGAGAAFIARDYNIGTSVRMGPGYFPVILGVLLMLVGGISMIRSFFHHGEAIPRFVWRDIFLVLGSVTVFGLTIRGAGLLPSLFVMVVICAYASSEFRLRTAVLLAAGSAIFSALVFVKGLGMPLAIIGPWFGM